MSGRLQGRIAVITGTASGMGRAAALVFAAEGATVIGADIDAAGNAETVDLVRAAGGVMETGAPVDLTTEDEVRDWIDDAAKRHGPIHILYANAGATRFAPLEEVTYAEWDFVLRHELDVVFLPAKHAWRHLRAASGSSVVLVGSTAAIRGSTTNPRVAHSVAKGGIVAMTRQLAAEGAPFGIRVNCVSPGLIETPATAGDLLAAGSVMRTADRSIPLGRFGRAEEVAKVALFLAGEDSSYMTGANVVVDGGWSAVLPGR
jgi:meso-butanediol dehydrogenase / (S,S)-butanediol dehydrogenase / diacetyl reductase